MKEKEPNGIEQHAPGAKLDEGKVRVGLVLKGFCNAFWEVARVGTFGANKYSDYGFLTVENGEARYADAQLRHFLKDAMGEELDPETEISHLAAEAWNALAKLEVRLREMKKNG